MKPFFFLTAIFVCCVFTTYSQNYAIGTKVEILATDGKTYIGTIKEVLNGKYNVHYEGYDFDAWLTAEQFKVKDQKIAGEQNTTKYNEYVNQGIARYDKNDMDAAISYYTLAVNLMPTEALAYYDRGLAYYNKHNYEAAILDFSMSIQYNPTDHNAYYYRGLSNVYNFNYVNGKKDYTKVIELDPKNFDAYYGRGYIYLMQFDYEAAKQDYSQAILIKPGSTDGYISRAYVELINGDNDGAIADYSKAIGLKTDFYDGYYSRGFAYLNKGNYEASIRDYNKAVALKPDSTNGYISLIFASVANKSFSKARELYNHYKSSGINSYIEYQDYAFVKSYIEAATQYLVLNNYKGALPVLLRSLNEYSSSRQVINEFYKYFYANILATTGWVYQQLDSLDKSTEFYQKALAVNSQNQTWIANLNELKSSIAQRNEQDRTPPEIILLTPRIQPGQAIETDDKNRLFVSGKAIDKSGIKWVRVNGVSVENLTQEGYFSTYVKDAGNKLVIQAEDKQGNIEPGKEFTLGSVKKIQSEIVTTPIPIDEKPGFHAVLIACSKYTGAGGWGPLPTTIEEAKSLKNVLIKKYGFPEKNILELYDKGKDDITTALSSKLESLTSNDNLVILYSGHGMKEERGSVLVGYWVPLNATDPNRGYISNSVLSDLIAGTKARHILIMSDACYSSAMRGSTEDAKKDEVLVPYKEEYKFESRRILTSGGLEKVPGNSKFMELIIEALERNNDSLLPEFYLYSLITPGVMKSTGNLPVIQSFGKDGNHGGQFYFIKR